MEQSLVSYEAKYQWNKQNVPSGNTFSYYTIGLAGLFIGLGEIVGEI